MVTNPIFDHFGDKDEQKLLDDILIEAIQFAGMDLYYLPLRSSNTADPIFLEDTQAYFDRAYLFEWYLDQEQGFSMPDFSNFGYFQNDQLTFQCAISRFKQEVTETEPTILRPREKDLLFFPKNGRLFEITYVENKPYFYQLGELQLFEVTTRIFNMQNEKFSTGVPEIDAIQPSQSLDQNDFASQSDFNNTQTAAHPTDNNQIIQERATEIINWDEKNPFADFSEY